MLVLGLSAFGVVAFHRVKAYDWQNIAGTKLPVTEKKVYFCRQAEYVDSSLVSVAADVTRALEMPKKDVHRMIGRWYRRYAKELAALRKPARALCAALRAKDRSFCSTDDIEVPFACCPLLPVSNLHRTAFLHTHTSVKTRQTILVVWLVLLSSCVCCFRPCVAQ